MFTYTFICITEIIFLQLLLYELIHIFIMILMVVFLCKTVKNYLSYFTITEISYTPLAVSIKIQDGQFWNLKKKISAVP